MRKVFGISVGLAMLGIVAANSTAIAKQDFYKYQTPSRNKAKNIILMVPDGMGLSYVTAARIFKGGPDGEPLSFEKLPVIGYQRTHSADSTVTDSAAAASAWAAGEKFLNGEISCHSAGTTECLSKPRTILEIAQRRGKSTGLISTSDITHATPAAFASHAFSRNCEAEIGRQMLETGVDVLLGGSIDDNSSKMTTCPEVTAKEVIDSAPELGYTVVETLDELNSAVSENKDKVLGLFSPKGKSPENFWLDENLGYPAEEPTLQEMTASALDILEKNRKGFFLMVEGSQIDWAGHGNRLGIEDTQDPTADNTIMGETLAFDAAVETVVDWVSERRERARNTLVIVVADHETGGFHVNGPYKSISKQGDTVEAGWTSGGHTAQDTIIWSQGPGSKELGRAIDNTDIFYVMRRNMSKSRK